MSHLHWLIIVNEHDGPGVGPLYRIECPRTARVAISLSEFCPPPPVLAKTGMHRAMC